MKRVLILAVLTLALAFGGASAASAKPVTPEAYDVTIHEEGGRSVMIVGGKLPDDTKLPAEIVLTAPTGWELQWAGEILGGELSDDIAAEPTTKTADGLDTYTFTLTKSLVGQLEVAGPPLTTFDGTTYTSGISWTPQGAAGRARISLALPANAKVGAGSDGAEYVPVDATGGYYTKTWTDVEAGKPLELAVSYSVPAAAPAPAAASNSVVPVIVVLAAVALFGGAFVAIRRKMTAGATELEHGEDEDVAETDSAEAAASDDGVLAAEADDGEEETPAAPAPRSKLPMIIVVGVLGVLVVFGFIAGNRSSATQAVDGVISRTYATGDACTQASIVLAPGQGVDLAKSADEILKPLETVPGVTTAALYPDESRVEVGYCDSSATEDQVRQALATSGLVTVE